jgi:hypothetical protein
MAKQPGHRPEPGEESGTIQNEIVWVLHRGVVLFRCWTMPLNAPSFRRISTDDRASARAFALFLIVALTFAVRADVSNATQAQYTALASALAVVLSIGLRTLSQSFHVRVREPLLISAYTSTIIVLFLYLFNEAFLKGRPLYESIREFGTDVLGDPLGTLGPMVVAVVSTYCLLVLKVVLWDRNTIGWRVAAHGALVVIGSGAIGWIITLVSNPVFDWIVSKLSALKGGA